MDIMSLAFARRQEPACESKNECRISFGVLRQYFDCCYLEPAD